VSEIIPDRAGTVSLIDNIPFPILGRAIYLILIVNVIPSHPERWTGTVHFQGRWKFFVGERESLVINNRRPRFMLADKSMDFDILLFKTGGKR
jgi:hypothetical protein